MDSQLNDKIYSHLTHTISETSGLSLMDTLELMPQTLPQDIQKELLSFQNLLNNYRTNQGPIEPLFSHPLGQALYRFFNHFPLRYREEHIHLTGSLKPEYIFPRIEKLLKGPHKALYEKKIKEVYGEKALPIKSVEDVNQLICLKEGEKFERYLEILFLAKLTLNDGQAHAQASYHLAENLWNHYNIGAIRLKFSLSRATTQSKEQIPGIEGVTPEDALMGLYEGLKKFKQEHPPFQFILSPCFRKEPSFYDSHRFAHKKEDFDYQVSELRRLLKANPELVPHVVEVDTVGSEKNLYRKSHFQEMKVGFRKLQAMGLKIRSHHGETWETLRRGIQSVDNAMNIWHVDAVEHGLSLGINPHYYYHGIFQQVMECNRQGLPLPEGVEKKEILAMEWGEQIQVRDKLIQGTPLDKEELTCFVKTKFHMAKEVEHYQHDVLNRMIDKQLSVIALPSSNKKLTNQFQDYRDHPFSWWEKKGVKLGVGTDNYVTLNTNYIQEMLILLFTNPLHLKITKLLMVCTGETRRPYISQKLWQMREQTPLGL